MGYREQMGMGWWCILVAAAINVLTYLVVLEEVKYSSNSRKTIFDGMRIGQRKLKFVFRVAWCGSCEGLSANRMKSKCGVV